MKISEIYKTKNTVLSFEVFPPKPDMPLETVYDTIVELKDLKPDFISVTYGAGGGNRDRTVEISSKVKNFFNTEVLSHITCVASSTVDIDNILVTLQHENIENIMALRGDSPKDIPDYNFENQEFKHASDLIKHIRNRGNFCIGGACYPEGHLEADSINADIEHLKYKVNQGVDFLLTQIFYNNESFYNFIDLARSAGIDIPISAGIMPIFNTKMIKRMTLMCGALLPKKLIVMLNKFENSPEDLLKAGVEYASMQIKDLISHGVNGIHLSTMNRSEQIKQIVKEVLG